MKLVGITKRFSKSYKEITMMESFFEKIVGWRPGTLLTHFSPVLPLTQRPAIWFVVQIKWLISIWNAALGPNELNKRVRNCCFPVNFAKILEELFQKNLLKQLFLLSLKTNNEHRMQVGSPYGAKYWRVDQVNLCKTAFKKFEGT